VAPLLRQLGSAESSPALRLSVEDFARWADDWSLPGLHADKTTVPLDSNSKNAPGCRQRQISTPSPSKSSKRPITPPRI